MTKQETPLGWSPAARSERDGRKSGFDGVGTLAILGLGGCDGHAHLLADGPREKAAHAMRLPPRRFHQFGQLGAFRPLQQIEDLCRFTALPDGSFIGGFGRFLRGAGLLGCLPLLRRNVRARCADTSPFRGFRLLGRLSGSGFFNSCIHVISFRGNRRGEDINHSGAPKMQVNSGGIANESHR